MLLASVPDVVLNNSAVKGLRMPALGLGTGAYANFDNSSVECWAGDVNQKCAARAHDSIVQWIKLGGKRLDCANAYYNQKVVGKAWKASGAKREDLFLLTKVGPSLPLGYQDTKDQFKQILADLQTDYVDAVLIHWPFLNPKHNDPPKGRSYCWSLL
jgi:diketogulonate reductase-like aldo/keto reductase